MSEVPVDRADVLEDDDEFEEFEAEWNPSGAPKGDAKAEAEGSARDWQDDWDDEKVDDEFGKRLRAELQKVQQQQAK